MADMPNHCPECGAPEVGGIDCWAQFCIVLSWEWQYPELLAAHFLTVASYNLQHPSQFEQSAIEELKASLSAHLEGRLSVAEIRRAARARYDGKRRVRREPGLRRPVLQLWPMTVADVYLSGDRNGAAGRVREWASSIANQLR